MAESFSIAPENMFGKIAFINVSGVFGKQYSNPSKTSKSNLNWKTADEDQLKDNDEGGNILTLCRVLLKKTLSIDYDITEEDVQNAFHGGYDSIYSKSRSVKNSINLLSI